jgi:hypothetical protein
MNRFGATPGEWDHFSLIAGLTADLLPVVSNPTAPVSPNSSIKQLGKLPSLYNAQRKVIGLTGWTEKISAASEIGVWSKEPDYGICCVGRTLKFLDIDIESHDESARIAMFIAERIGVLPLRRRSNSGKILLAFTMLGEYPKRTLKTRHGLIEFLANKQQALLAGTHTSGARYEWNPLPDRFPEIEPSQFDKLWAGLAAVFGIAEPDTGSIRNPLSAMPLPPDPLADYLLQHWENYGTGKEGEVRILCPFKADHTIDNGPSETVYFRQGTRSYSAGHWSCMHAHCQDKKDSDFEIATGYTANDFNEIIEPQDASPAGRYDPIRADIFNNRPPIAWIIKNILPRDGLGMTFGGSGDGKTFAVLDMVLAICLGKTWNGYKTVQGHVVYICAEGAGGFASRLRAYSARYANPMQDIGDYLTIIPETPNFRTDKDIKEIAKSINNLPYKVDLIVIDTLAQVTPGADENTGKDMSLAIRHTELLGSLTGATPHLIHHAGKDENKGARGWSGMKGPLAVQFQVSREGENRLFWIAKLKDGRDGFGFNFNLQTIQIGRDLDDEDMSSCYVEYTGRSGSKKKAEKRGKSQTLLLGIFDEINESGKLLLERLVSAFVAKLPYLDTTKRDRRRDTAFQALNSVLEEGVLISEGDYIRYPDLDSK